MFPSTGLRWFFDHAETISRATWNGSRPWAAASPSRIAWPSRGNTSSIATAKQAAEQAPPIARMLSAGVPVGAGTDATRVASYNPWVSLYWLRRARRSAGHALYPEANRLDRTEALRLYTAGSAWFSGEEGRKGSIEVGKAADLAVLSADYFSVPEEEIKGIESVLTVVAGQAVYGSGEFSRYASKVPPVSPGWSPVAVYGGYPTPATGTEIRNRKIARVSAAGLHSCTGIHGRRPFWLPGCDCFAF